MSKNTYINVRVESSTKHEVEEILDTLGMNMSTAIDIYLSQIKLKKGLPFQVKVPKSDVNTKTLELAQALNLTGGKPFPKRFNKIVSLYANGDIDYDVALYAIKKEYING